MDLDDSFSKTEPDEEIQDLLKFSVGLNLGLHFLSGAITYDPLVSNVNGHLASKVVLLDSMIMNIDRTAKNTNLINWKSKLWLIDHGASLYFHHNWKTWRTYLDRTFPNIKDHVLLERADQLIETVGEIKSLITASVINDIVDSLPEDWLIEDSNVLLPSEIKTAYKEFLNTRIANLETLANEAKDAR